MTTENAADDQGHGAAAPADTQPLLRVISPGATPEEVAALVTVFAALGSGGEPAPEPPRSEWASPSRRMRTPLAHGPGAWRASALTR